MRFQDVANIYDIEIVGAMSIQTSSTFEKMTKGGKVQITTIPLLDYRGRSLRPAVEALQAQKGESYILRDTCAVKAGLRSKERSPPLLITSQQGLSDQQCNCYIVKLQLCISNQ